MNEDMSEILNKLTSIVNNQGNKEGDNSSISGNSSISPEMISNMVKMLGAKNNSEDKNTEESNNSAPNIDFETIMKFKNIFDKMNSKDDPRTKLLLALKPYLKESRKEKVEQYIQFFNISKVIDIFGSASGGDVHK